MHKFGIIYYISKDNIEWIYRENFGTHKIIKYENEY